VIWVLPSTNPSSWKLNPHLVMGLDDFIDFANSQDALCDTLPFEVLNIRRDQTYLI